MSNNTQWEEEESTRITRGDSDAPPAKIYAMTDDGYVICQHCGEPIYPNELSDNKFSARKEVKWQMHMACVSKLHKMIDMEVPGLLAERSAKVVKETPKPTTKPKSFAQIKSKFKR